MSMCQVFSFEDGRKIVAGRCASNRVPADLSGRMTSIPRYYDHLANRFAKGLPRALKIMESARYARDMSYEGQNYFIREYGHYLKQGNVEAFIHDVCHDLYAYAFVRGMEWQQRHANEKSTPDLTEQAEDAAEQEAAK